MTLTDRYKQLINWLSTTGPGSAFARRMARFDPLVYRATGGRFTLSGIPTIPQLVLTTTGRKSGLARPAQVAAVPVGDGFIVVGSNFGQTHHPAWALNLLANPEARIDVGRERWLVKAERLSSEERDATWALLDEHVPQFRVYRRRTDRDLNVFRLRRLSREI